MTLPDAASESPPPPASMSSLSDAGRRWNPATLVAFRFCFVYVSVYFLTTQMLRSFLLVPGLNVPDFSERWPMEAIVMWVGTHVLHVHRVFAPHPTGSGDTAFNWVHAATVLLIAAVATIVWSALARRTERYDRLYRWFRVGLRFALGTTMLTYGLSKVIPLQMPAPSLTRFVEPYGNFSPMGVLWYSIGAARPYEIFVGLAETCAGCLLFLPRTALLGALMCLMDTIAILTLNLTYDVPVKLFAFHLVVFSCILIAPSARNLFDFFLRRRPVQLSGEPPVGSTPPARRGLVIAQVVFGAYVLLLGIWGSAQAWALYGGGAPVSPLYGIWTVDQMTIDGQDHPALLTDSTRWRRVIFQQPPYLSSQKMNDAVLAYPVTIDTTKHTLAITARDSAQTKSTLTYQRPTATHLIIDGPIAGHVLHLDLSSVDLKSFMLKSRGFNWIQEFPVNR